MSAPAVERALRNSSSNRLGTRSSSTARSSSESTSSRPSSQPNFSTQLPDLDPWDTMEKVATAPAPPHGWSGTSAGNSTGWTVFPESSPSAAPRAAWGTGPPQVAPTINNNSYKPHNGYKRFYFVLFSFFSFLFTIISEYLVLCTSFPFLFTFTTFRILIPLYLAFKVLLLSH